MSGCQEGIVPFDVVCEQSIGQISKADWFYSCEFLRFKGRCFMSELDSVLGHFLERKAAASWERNGAPYFLSALPPEFKLEGHDYKDVIGDERLKSAAKRLSERYGFKVVEHPTIKAKVGVIPKDQIFEFSTERSEKKLPVRIEQDSVEERRRIVLDFLELIGRLPPDLLSEVSIPAKVLSRLVTRL